MSRGMVEEQKTRLSVVIEPDGFDCRRTQLSAREAFFMNAHPLELMRRVPESEWGWVLREIERHQRELDAQRTPEQREWACSAATRGAVGTLRAAERLLDLS